MTTGSYICLECGEIFDEPLMIKETHGFTDGTYEEIPVCPGCHGSFATVHYCDACEEPITDNYIKTYSGEELCDNCFFTEEFGAND